MTTNTEVAHDLVEKHYWSETWEGSALDVEDVVKEALQAKDTQAEEMMREVLDLANEMHTTLKIGDTDGSEFNKGYVLYQDMVLDILKETKTIAQKYGIDLNKDNK